MLGYSFSGGAFMAAVLVVIISLRKTFTPNTVEYDLFIKSQLTSHNQLEGLL